MYSCNAQLDCFSFFIYISAPLFVDSILSCRFASAFGVDLEQLRLACKFLNTSEDRSFVSAKTEDVWATVFAIVYFELKLKDEADEWDLLAEKAETWLASMVDADQLQNIRCAASSFLQKCDGSV